MTATKAVVPRKAAVQDVEAAINHYSREASDETALGFIEELRQAYTHISRHPAGGSTRLSQELNIPGLRCWPVRRYPYLIFYIERMTSIDVWRVLHGNRDIPLWMQISSMNE